MEFLDTVLGAGIAGVFYLLGRSRARLARPKPVRAFCEGCKHHRSFHGEDGSCTSMEMTFDDEVCRCLRYSGPRPLSEIMDEDLGITG